MKLLLLQCMSPQMARLRHHTVPLGIPLAVPKPTCRDSAPRAGFDP